MELKELYEQKGLLVTQLEKVSSILFEIIQAKLQAINQQIIKILNENSSNENGHITEEDFKESTNI